MGTRKPRIFLSSVFRKLKNERRTIRKIIKKYSDKFEFTGYEEWESSKNAIEQSKIHAIEADYFILILGYIHGSRDPNTDISITETEFNNFIYSHAIDCNKYSKKISLFIYEKSKENIQPDDIDVPGKDREDLIKFKDRVKRRYCLPVNFKDWDELQNQIDSLLKQIPSPIEIREYNKISTDNFDFNLKDIFGDEFDGDHIVSKWSECPCSVHKNGSCEYDNKLYFKPPMKIKSHMDNYLSDYLSNNKINQKHKEQKESFKVTMINMVGNKIEISFCNSTWHYFLSSNLAATKNSKIAALNKKQLKCNFEITKSPFSNNLGFTIVIIDKRNERVLITIREKENVALYPNLKSASIGTQLHAYDPRHRYKDGTPNIINAIYTELYNEAKIENKDIDRLYLAGWGIGTRTGFPEFIFICETNKKLSEIANDIKMARVKHLDEFDRVKMQDDNFECVSMDVEVIAQLLMKPEEWEPESAIAACLAFNILAPGSVIIK